MCFTPRRAAALYAALLIGAVPLAQAQESQPAPPAQGGSEAATQVQQKAQSDAQAAESQPAAQEGAAAPAATGAELQEVVVTGRRVEAALDTTPQRVEIINRETIERTPARDFTDMLKKNSSVDVIQYPANKSSGIGIRGFRPEYSGINQHTLILIDGRPAMTPNLSVVNMDQIERVEVLKGPASALYGSSAMGGVVNIITRKSRGKPSGFAEIGYGSYDTRQARLSAGGKIAENVDFDYSFSHVKQGDDLKMGNGEVRPHTSYREQNHALRLGLDFNSDWRLNMNGDLYRGRSIAVPGSLATGTNNQTNKNIDRYGVDVALEGRIQKHNLMLRHFKGKDETEVHKKTSSTASEQPYLPFHYYTHTYEYDGWQLQDKWGWSDWGMTVAGIDYDEATSVAQYYRATGERRAPSSADNGRKALGVFIQNSLFFNNERTVIDFGIRRDRITTEIMDTPYKTGYLVGKARFSTVNPSLGFRQKIGERASLHSTIGRGFVPPAAFEMTTYSVTTRSGKDDVLSGNPNLKPESSITWDIGAGWNGDNWQADVTYFHTRVKDKVSRIQTGEDAQNRYFMYTNADSARIQGIEVEGKWRARPWLTLTASGTHYIKRKETAAGVESDIRNIPKTAIRLGFDVNHGPWSGRLGVRHVGKWKDNNWIGNSSEILTYSGFTIADVFVRYDIDRRQSVSLRIDNLFDRYYAEKGGYPLAGRNFRVNYQYRF